MALEANMEVNWAAARKAAKAVATAQEKAPYSAAWVAAATATRSAAAVMVRGVMAASQAPLVQRAARILARHRRTRSGTRRRVARSERLSRCPILRCGTGSRSLRSRRAQKEGESKRESERE